MKRVVNAEYICSIKANPQVFLTLSHSCDYKPIANG